MLAAVTVRLALEVLPVPPSVEVTCTELFFNPAVVPVTSTEKLHVDPAVGDAVNVPPDRLMLPLAAVAVIVPLPHDPVTFGGVATTTPDGKLSVNATPLSATPVFGLVMLKLNVLLAFNGMLVGLNDLIMLGGLATVRVADAAAPLPPSVELIGPVLFR